MKKIKQKCQNYLVIPDRVKNCIFKQFFTVLNLQFIGTLMHKLFLRKIEPKSKNKMHFLLGSNNFIFGIGKFSLVKGLNCGVQSLKVDIKEKGSS